MFKSRPESPVVSTTAALIMIGLACNKTLVVNCAEGVKDNSYISSIKRSPSPLNEEMKLEERRIETSNMKESGGNIRKYNLPNESKFNFSFGMNENLANDVDENALPSISSSDCISDIEEFIVNDGRNNEKGKASGKSGKIYKAIMNQMQSVPDFTEIFSKSELAYVDAEVGDVSLANSKESSLLNEYKSNDGKNFISQFPVNNTIVSGHEISNEVKVDSKPSTFNLHRSDSQSPPSRVRSISSANRVSRDTSTDLNLATASFTVASNRKNVNCNEGVETTLSEAEIQIREELMALITVDSIAPLNLIDNYASDALCAECNNVGTYILGHLAQQAAKMPTTPSTSLAFNLLQQIGRVFTLVTQTLSPDDRLDYRDIIVKCLEMTILDDPIEYNSFTIVRDALILLMMNFQDIFNDNFLRQDSIYKILKEIIVKSNDLDQFDTIDYIRLLLHLRNNFDLGRLFRIKLNRPERTLSEEAFLTLKESNLKPSASTSSKSERTTVKSSPKKSLKRNSKKNYSNVALKRTSVPQTIAYKIFIALRLLLRFCWLNKVVLFYSLIIAFILQHCVFQGKGK